MLTIKMDAPKEIGYQDCRFLLAGVRPQRRAFARDSCTLEILLTLCCGRFGAIGLGGGMVSVKRD